MVGCPRLRQPLAGGGWVGGPGSGGGTTGARRHDVVICNFANADMVGHTGRLDATVAAVEAAGVDLGDVADVLEAEGVSAFVKSFDELLVTLGEKVDALD